MGVSSLEFARGSGVRRGPASGGSFETRVDDQQRGERLAIRLARQGRFSIETKVVCNAFVRRVGGRWLIRLVRDPYAPIPRAAEDGARVRRN